jgi:hypothetical protein
MASELSPGGKLYLEFIVCAVIGSIGFTIMVFMVWCCIKMLRSLGVSF